MGGCAPTGHTLNLLLPISVSHTTATQVTQAHMLKRYQKVQGRQEVHQKLDQINEFPRKKGILEPKTMPSTNGVCEGHSTSLKSKL